MKAKRTPTVREWLMTDRTRWGSDENLIAACMDTLGVQRDVVVRRLRQMHDKTGSSAEFNEAMSEDRIIALLQKKRRSTASLAEMFRQPESDVEKFIKAMQDRGVLICKYGDEWGVATQPHPVDAGLRYTYHSRDDGTYLFAIISDTHLGSKYERLDVLEDLYDRFAAAGVDRVFHGGNWIDGESRLNRHELHTFGLDGQCKYMADCYPRRDGLDTFAIWGDCHEGWFSKDAKLDVGRHMERVMEDAGRADWHNLGFLESYVPLKNSNTGKVTHFLLMHPGGGTAYAISYKPQKIVEGLSGGEKPAVLGIGHFHKMEHIIVRNVQVFQLGCTQDQSTWTRKNRIEPVIGGWIVRLTQDPRTGAIYGCRGEWIHYFNKGYYNERWSPYGPVAKPEKTQIPE